MLIQMLQDCNHKILNRSQNVTSSPITMKRGYIKDPQTGDYTLSSATQDQIVDKLIAIHIDELYVMESNVKRIISPTVYTLYNNRIIWLDTSLMTTSGAYTPPTIGQTYYIGLKYYAYDYKEYTASNCPRCYSRGWFMNFTQDGNDIYAAAGPYVVAQEFIKCLANIQSSDRLDLAYGTNLFDGDVRYLDSKLVEDVRQAVISAESQCKALQAMDVAARPDNEILESAIINSIELDEENTAVIVNITLVTVYGNKISFNIGT